MLRSQLASQLLLLFACLALLEAVFLAILSLDILESNSSAMREYNIVQASQNMSETLQAARQLWNSRSAASEGVGGSNQYKQCQENFLKIQKLTAVSMREIGIDAESVSNLENHSATLDKAAQAFFTATPEKRDAAEEAYQNESWECSRALLREMRHIHKTVSKAKAEQTVFGLEPLSLIYLAAAVTLLFLAVIVLFVERSITRPITNLVADCQKIRMKVALPKPRTGNSEISALEQSFYSMSITIAEDEKKRKGYLEFLQDVQTAALVRVDSWLNELSHSTSLPQKAKTRITNSRDNLSSLLQLLDSMTDTLNADLSGAMKLRRSRTGISKLLKQCRSSLESTLQQRSITLVIPETDQFYVFIDPILIGRVLLNFLSNAIKYSPQGETVTVSIAQDRQFLSFSIKDNGPGIPISEQDKLFQKFSQVSAADGLKRAGSGLGLLICKDIVEAHGGKIGCASAPGAGSRFWFTLPLKQTAEATMPPQGPESVHFKTEVSTDLLGGRGGASPPAGEHGSPLLEARGTEAIIETGSGARAGASSRSSPSAPKRRTSLKWHFIFILFIFLLVQGSAFLMLEERMNESKQRAITFAQEKNMLLDTEELFGLILLWAKQTDVALTKSDYGAIARGMPLLRELKNKSAKLMARSEKNCTITKELSSIHHDAKHLIAMADYAMSHLDEIADTMSKLIDEAHKCYTSIDEALDRLMKVEGIAFQSSFDWSEKLRAEMLSILIATASIDLVIIAAAVMKGLEAARKITLLKKKADDFAQGKSQLQPSVSGNDELTVLDQRFCEVANSIREAEAQRQELIAVINHDLRTPLSSIMNGLQIIYEGVLGKLEGADAEQIEKSESELQRLLKQINDLLTLEKIDAGAFKLSQEKLNIADLLSESAKSSEQSRKKKRLRLSVEPAQTELQTTELLGDRQLLERLYSIVLDNAVAASPESSRLRLSVLAHNDRIISELEDQGGGIDPQLMHCLFERFRFLNNQPIPGLGLPLAQRICQLHKGSISIKSTNRTGTTIVIELPHSSLSAITS